MEIPQEKISVVEAAQHRPYELIKTKVVKTLEKFQGNDLSESVFGEYLDHSYYEQPIKRQPHNIVKHTQTVPRQQPNNCLSVFDHFVVLALKGLTFHFLVLVVVDKGRYL